MASTCEAVMGNAIPVPSDGQAAAQELQEVDISEREDFSIGELVWGRFSGSRWWPAVIYDPERTEKPVKTPRKGRKNEEIDPEKAVKSAKKGSKPGRQFVSFFGDNTVCWIDKALLLPFEENLVRLAKQAYTPLFQKAVEEALEHIEEVGAAVAFAQVKGTKPVRTVKEGLVLIVADIPATVGPMVALDPTDSLLYLKRLAIGQVEAPHDRAAGARARGVLLALKDAKRDNEVTAEQIVKQAARTSRARASGDATPRDRDSGPRLQKKDKVSKSKSAARTQKKNAEVAGKKDVGTAAAKRKPRASKAEARGSVKTRKRQKSEEKSIVVSTPVAVEESPTFKRRGRFAQMQTKDGKAAGATEESAEEAKTSSARKRQGRKSGASSPKGKATKVGPSRRGRKGRVSGTEGAENGGEGGKEEQAVPEVKAMRGRKRKLEESVEEVLDGETESARKRKKVEVVEDEALKESEEAPKDGEDEPVLVEENNVEENLHAAADLENAEREGRTEGEAVEEMEGQKGKAAAARAGKGKGRQKKGDTEEGAEKEGGVKGKRFTRWNNALAKSPEAVKVTKGEDDPSDPFVWNEVDKDENENKTPQKRRGRKRGVGLMRH